jgi:hypothetical protein
MYCKNYRFSLIFLPCAYFSYVDVEYLCIIIHVLFYPECEWKIGDWSSQQSKSASQDK